MTFAPQEEDDSLPPVQTSSSTQKKLDYGIEPFSDEDVEAVLDEFDEDLNELEADDEELEDAEGDEIEEDDSEFEDEDEDD
jgi:hypothetical protein